MHTIATPCGPLVAQHTTDDLRKKEVLPVTYHRSGHPRSVPLETQTRVSTPAGDIPTELITFHENGAVNRVFPLNGKLSGYWSEADEAGLATPLTIHTPIGPVSAKIISVGFFDSGSLRSITLWPGETVSMQTPAGHMDIRIGISFAPDGSIRSVEPAKPTPVMTKAGEITAFDPDAMGVNGDMNSLVFDESGSIIRLTTTTSRVKAVHPDGRVTCIAPQYRESYCSDTAREVIPMRLKFEGGTFSAATTPEEPSIDIPMDKHLFFAEPHLPQLDLGQVFAACSP